jgi:ATP-dependent RNA helicase DDX10/DBP4
LNNKEESFIQNLGNIEIKKIKINQNKMANLQPILRSILSENKDLINLAQKTIKSYIKSVYIQPDKNVFDIKGIDIQKLALSYGLMNLPELRLIKHSQNDLKNSRKVGLDEQASLNQEQSQDAKEITQNENNEAENGPAKKINKKLDKFKKKIQEKKALKLASLEKTEDNIPESFLKIKRNRDGITEKTSDNKDNIQELSITSEEDNNEDDRDYYSRLKFKMDENKESEKIAEKNRILKKHREDRLKKKQLDYEKHGINQDKEDEDEGVQLGNDELDLEEQPIKQDKKEKIKIKPIPKSATIEDKEKAALELLNKTNPLFG